MSDSAFVDSVRQYCSRHAVRCICDIGCGSCDRTAPELFSRDAQYFGIDPLLPDGVPGYRGTLEDLLTHEDSVLPRADLVVCADVLHYMENPSVVLCRCASQLARASGIIVRECIADFRTSSPSGPACILHECKALVDRTRGVSHGPLYSRDEIARVLDSLPVEWTSRRVVPGNSCPPETLEQARQETIDYADLVADRADVYARVTRSLRQLVISERGTYRFEDRLLAVGRFRV